MTTKQIDGTYLTFGAEGVRGHYDQEIKELSNRYTAITMIVFVVCLAGFSLCYKIREMDYQAKGQVNKLLLEKLAADCQKKCEQVNNAYCTGL